MSVRYGALKADLLSLMGCLEREGTCSTGGGAGLLVDAGVLTDQDDFFIGKRIYIHNGTSQGDEREITDSDSSDASVTVAPNWTTTLTGKTDAEYFIYDTFRIVTVNRALITALRLLRRHTLLPMVDDTSLTLGDPTLAATYELTVPTNFAAVREIWREDGSLAGLFTMHIPGPGDTDCPWWYPVRSSTRKIRLDKAIADHHGWIEKDKKLRIVGQQYQAEPTDDDSTFDINTGPLLVLAAALLRLQLLSRAEDVAATRTALVKALENVSRGQAFIQGSVIFEEA